MKNQKSNIYFPSKIDTKKCEYLSEDSLPVLVLALDYDYKLSPFNAYPDLKWKYIGHQTAGHGCHQHYFLGALLTPKKEVLEVIKEIDEKYYESDEGMWGAITLEKANEYNGLLKKKLGCECDYSYYNFEEGLYPIDCCAGVVQKLVEDKLPSNLNDLLLEETFVGSMDRWKIYILGRNCD